MVRDLLHWYAGVNVIAEQAWATAFLFSGVPTMFRAVDEINFIAPVDIGTVCVFNSSTYPVTLSATILIKVPSDRVH